MFNLSTQEVVLSIENAPLVKLNGLVYQEYNNFFGIVRFLFAFFILDVLYLVCVRWRKWRSYIYIYIYLVIFNSVMCITDL